MAGTNKLECLSLESFLGYSVSKACAKAPGETTHGILPGR